MLELLKNEKYDRLEFELYIYLNPLFNSPTTEMNSELALEAFSLDLPWMEDKIRKWMVHSSESEYPYLVYGLYHWRLGWTSRGQKVIAVTPRKQIDTMTYHLNIAKQNFDRALDIQPNLGIAYSYLINIAMPDRGNQDLEQYYTKGQEIAPYAYQLHLFYSFELKPRWGGSMQKLRAFSSQMTRLSQYNTRLKPLQGVVTVEKGDQSLYSRQYQDAIKWYREAEKLGGYWYLYLNIGNAFTRLKDFDNAEHYYKMLINTRPMYVDGYFKLAEMYLFQGNYEKSLNQLNIVQKISAPTYKYYTLHGQLLFNIGDYENTLKDIEAALVMKPQEHRLLTFKALTQQRMKANTL